jgi:hypothetical protein
MSWITCIPIFIFLFSKCSQICLKLKKLLFYKPNIYEICIINIMHKFICFQSYALLWKKHMWMTSILILMHIHVYKRDLFMAVQLVTTHTCRIKPSLKTHIKISLGLKNQDMKMYKCYGSIPNVSLDGEDRPSSYPGTKLIGDSLSSNICVNN